MGTELAGAVAPCPRCGEGCVEGARYCSRCGLPLLAAAGPAATPPPAPPSTPTPVPVAPAIAPLEGAGPPAAASMSPAPTPVPAALASAVGRRASAAGWAAAGLGILVFLGAAVGIILAGGGFGGVGVGGAPGTEARWDRSLRTPSRISAGEPFRIEAEAVNDGREATGLVWLVVEWRASGGTAHGRVSTCDPSDCRIRNDPATATSAVFWPALEPGTRRVLALGVAVDGVAAGAPYEYRVRVGTGPDQGSLAGGYTWTLDPEVE